MLGSVNSMLLDSDWIWTQVDTVWSQVHGLFTLVMLQIGFVILLF